MVPNIDIIASIRSMRKMIITLDSLVLPISELVKDEEIAKNIPKNLDVEIIATTTKIHVMLQGIEKSKRYKEAVKNLCDVKEGSNG